MSSGLRKKMHLEHSLVDVVRRGSPLFAAIYYKNKRRASFFMRVNKNFFLRRQFVVVEKLEGRTVSSFIGQPPSVLQSLGEGLARIHVNQKRYAGNPSGTFRVELSDFHQHVITGMKQIVSSFYADHHQIAATLPDIIGGLKDLPAPDSSSFVLIDMDPSQFLSDGRTITGLVDTEAYVIAPRAFDFIGLEYILDEASAAEFSIGYEKVMPLPDLTFVRLPYRYLYRLLSVQGSVDLDEWLESKTLF